MSDPNQHRLDLLVSVLDRAKKSGATAADVIYSQSTSVGVARRLGKADRLERSEEGEIGLRVFHGARQALVSSSDLTPQRLMEMADRAVAMAQAVPEDPWCGLAEESQLTHSFPDLDLCEPLDPDVSDLTALADAAEEAARSLPGITNSEGAEVGYGREVFHLVASNGFSGSFESTGCSISVAVIAGSGEGMEAGYDYDTACYFSDLRAAADVGKCAAERALRALNPRKGKTCRAPVVFDYTVAGGLLGSLSAACNGAAIARGTSFIKDKMGEQIFSESINIIDDPFIKRGRRSIPFDAEGLAPSRRLIVENGVLKGWFLDLASARQLGLSSTGNAVRGTGSVPRPRPYNFYMQAGSKSREDMIKEIEEGFLVTRLMGGGGNSVTGDYSRGAAGFWIEKGEIAYPVNEMTIAGNLRDMWMSMEAANDLDLRQGFDAPTVRIDGMTIAGM